MKRLFSMAGLFAAAALLLGPLGVSAAPTFEISGWMPYWRAATSTADVLPHLNQLTEINPFVYGLKSDGTIFTNQGGDLSQEPWASLIVAARANHVRVIPTIMTGNGDLVHSLLSNAASRVALEKRIADFVKTNNFDGIDIDFEGKHAADKNYFSTFLKGLYQRLGSKWLMCDIEARTPVGSRYYGTDIPPDATIYANDFAMINKYCDRVRIMAYDQQGVDLQLAAQAASSSQLYAPVADPVWVTKVVNLAAKQISRNKILIGVPTYGYEYDVTAYAQKQYIYDILWTFNPGYALPLAQQYGVTPERNAAGELFFTYTPNASSTVSTTSAPLSGGSALLAASAASLYADTYNSHLTFRLVEWPDATSIAQKIALAKQLGVRGIAIFKLDGGEDPAMWNVLQGAVSTPPSGLTSAGAGAAIVRGLDIGSTGEDVRTLQRILNSDVSTKVATSGTGSPGHEGTYFGPATATAVGKFQVKYGLAKPGSAGYGFVGPATRAKLNAILASL